MRPPLALAALVWLLALGVGPAALAAQKPPRPAPGDESPKDRPGNDELKRAAAAFRSAWLAHDPAKLVANTTGITIQLPGAEPSAALGPRQAAALLGDFLAKASEVEVAVRAVREMEPRRGYVELRRRYRVDGTQDARGQTLFLGYRHTGGRWVLVELRAIEP